MILTQRMIDKTAAPAIGFKELRESGLVLRLFASGKRSWSFEYRSPVTGKTGRIGIEGPSLAEARAVAQRHRVTLSEGRDPNLEAQEALQARRAEHARAVTVGASLDNYEGPFLAKSPHKQQSRRNRMRNLRNTLAPLHARAVASIPRDEMIRLLDDIQEARGPIARNRAHAEICAWLGWAALRGHVPFNVLNRVRKEISEKSRARTRVLTDAELGAMLAATADGAPFSDIVRVLVHTGMRRDEAASLQARDLDFEARRITVRPFVDKTKKGHDIPMVEAIAPMLKARVEGLSREQYIFGEGSGFRGPFSGFGKPTDRLRAAMPEGERWSLHDIRRTVATRLHKAKVHPLVIEDLLGHISGIRGGVAGVYNVAETFDDQRAALAGWADQLAGLAGANVVPFKRSA